MSITNLAITPELDAILLPTDSRRRPDRRALEVGDTAVASAEKRRIEEMQRTEEKARKESKQEWVPKYFKVCIYFLFSNISRKFRIQCLVTCGQWIPPTGKKEKPD